MHILKLKIEFFYIFKISLIMDIHQIYEYYKQSTGISIDIETIEKGKIFFALKEENLNEIKYINEALKKGALYVFSDIKLINKEYKNVVFVNDPLSTLQNLAIYHRKHFSVPFIVITGSNGKTTTKELTSRVLGKKYKVYSTKENLNHLVGLPFNVLSIPYDVQIVVLELGANCREDIPFLLDISKPNYGCITSFGRAHLEGFKSLEGVIESKSKLYEYLNQNNGLAFVNGENSIQMEKTCNQKRFVFSNNKDQDLFIKFIDSSFELKLGFKNLEINSKLIGEHNFTNISFAISIGTYFGISPFEIKNAIESYVSENARLQIIKKPNLTILLDSYNANPDSMKEALFTLSKFNGKKCVVLGDMFELGDYEKEGHQYIVDISVRFNFEIIYLIGENFKQTYTNNTRIKKFTDFKILKKELFSILSEYEINYLLLKGSRKMALERLIEE